MKVFRDARGREWYVSVNVTSIKRVKALVGVNLLDALGGDLAERLTTDTILLCDVLFALCKPEADTKGITDADFGESLHGEVLDPASVALIEEIIDFFPNERDRAALRRTMQLAQTVRNKARTLVETQLASGAIEKAVETAFKSASDSFGDALASLESTPVPLRSAS
jgi:hypothetical protein